MSIKIASRSSSGLRPQGTGGQTALEIHPTIDRYLRRNLSAAHADLFAEPNVVSVGSMVDWYASIETPAAPRLLSDVPEERRAALYARLAGLVNDIRTRALELRNSAQQSERLLGQLLLLALEVPGEDCVYALGDQPVLIFWGHLADVPMPQSGVIDRMIAHQTRAPLPMSSGPAAPSEPASPAPAGHPAPAMGAIGARLSRYPWAPWALWGVFAVLLLAIGLMLTRACGLGVPFTGALGPFLINYCPADVSDGAAALSDLEADNARLQSRLDRLLGLAAGQHAACAGLPLPGTDKVDGGGEGPGSGGNADFVIPPEIDEAKKCDFLAGCWGSDNTTITLKPVFKRYCFKTDCTGTDVSKAKDGSFTCEAPLVARLVEPGPKLVVEGGRARCTDGKAVAAYTLSCENISGKQAHCLGVNKGTAGGTFDPILARKPDAAR